MTAQTHDLGLRAEEAVASWLADRGWTVLARRWRTPAGELDLVCLDPQRCLVAVEVKLRSTGRTGIGEDALDRRQAHRLRVALGEFAAREPVAHLGLRIDLVALSRATDDRWRLRHLPGIDGW
ncbi:MAG TPA: YraN family protein [Candidatus Limnocylindria bacterium]